MPHVTVLAHAKVNLRLRVVGRRADGFHLLSMLNVTVGLADTLSIEFRERASGEADALHVVCDDPSDAALIPGQGGDNLVIRAIAGFRRRWPKTPPVEVRLRKSIPIGAGLGGGSSDAAAMIAALARFSAVGDTIEDRAVLHEVARECGSDVPYLLNGGVAIVRGVGEELIPVRLSGAVEILLIMPSFGISTPQVYQTLREIRPGQWSEEDQILNAAVSAPDREIKSDQLPRLVANDLEEPACRIAPELHDLLKHLREIPGGVCGMSGSGAALFALPTSAQYLSRISEALAGVPHRAWLTRVVG